MAAFNHSRTLHEQVPVREWRPHPLLDPKSVNREGLHAGRNIREALDSDEHPESTPIAIWFDVTGSMGFVPEILQRKLPELLDLLINRGVVQDPQIMMAAIGDAYSDKVPVQVGQFESDNRLDEQISSIFLEGRGGGSNHESYELAMYFMAYHTYIDSWEKRKKKGHLFIIGDERVYAAVNRDHVAEYIGGVSSELDRNIPTEEVYKTLTEKWNVNFIFPEESNMYTPNQVLPANAGTGEEYYGGAASLGWQSLVGEAAIIMSDAERICDEIARAVSVAEGTQLPV